jgi:hypothetical protein
VDSCNDTNFQVCAVTVAVCLDGTIDNPAAQCECYRAYCILLL